jgi:hypothetical protein
MSKIRMNKKVNKVINNIFESELKPMVEKEVLKNKLLKKLGKSSSKVQEQKRNNFPGKTETDKVLKKSNKQNSEALNLVAKKLKDYLNYTNNSNPEFPHQNNSKTDYDSPMYRNDTEQDEYVQNWRGMGLEDAQYQNEPNQSFKDRVDAYMNGSTETGNNAGKDSSGSQVGNVVPSDLGKSVGKKVKRKFDDLKSDKWAKAIPNKYGDYKKNPNHMISENYAKKLIMGFNRESKKLK